jgi:hypothetical protein
MKTKEVSIGQFFKDTPLPRGASLKANNGELLYYDAKGRLKDSLGRHGYNTHFTGAYVCYTCGHLCECED